MVASRTAALRSAISTMSGELSSPLPTITAGLTFYGPLRVPHEAEAPLPPREIASRSRLQLTVRPPGTSTHTV